jgi:hypothetical protein
MLIKLLFIILIILLIFIAVTIPYSALGGSEQVINLKTIMPANDQIMRFAMKNVNIGTETEKLVSLLESKFKRKFNFDTVESFINMECMLNHNIALPVKFTFENAIKYNVNPIEYVSFHDLDKKILDNFGRFSLAHRSKISERSKAFEHCVQERLDEMGIKYQTEYDLKGQSLTPDFLLENRQLFVNNEIVHWIDAKNYPHYKSALTKKKLRLQAEKYNNAFGPGLFVFNEIWTNKGLDGVKIIDIADFK